MLKNRIIYLLALIAAYIFFLFYRMWLSWFVLLVVASILPIALIMCIASCFFFNISFTPADRITKGDEGVIRVKAGNSNGAFCSFWVVKIKCENLMTGKVTKTVHRDIGRIVFDIPVDSSHCAVLRYTVASAKICDMFGLFAIRKKSVAVAETCVFPKPINPDVMPDFSNLNAKQLKKSNDPYTEIYDVRDYMTGDLPKHIHWKISAKKDKLLVKEAQEEILTNSNIYLHVDDDLDKFDYEAGILVFLSEYLLNREMEHKVCAVFDDVYSKTFDIKTKRDMDQAVLTVLKTKLSDVRKAAANGR